MVKAGGGDGGRGGGGGGGGGEGGGGAGGQVPSAIKLQTCCQVVNPCGHVVIWMLGTDGELALGHRPTCNPDKPHSLGCLARFLTTTKVTVPLL